MMKSKFFSLLATASILFAGCSSDEIFEEQATAEKDAIQFSVRLKNPKGIEMTDGQLKNTGFGVTAFYTEQQDWTKSSIIPNYMYNQQVSYEKNNWVYSPLKYWPSRKGDKISIFAYAPYEKTGETKTGVALSPNTQTGTPSIVFTTQDSPSEMVDFVASSIIDKTKNFEAGAVNTIDFNFMHELSRIQFTATNKTVNSYVNIKKAKLNFGENSNIYKTATYVFSNENNKRGVWNYENGQKFSGDYDLKGILYISQDVHIGKGEKPYDVDGCLLKSGDTELDIFDGKFLFFIPAEGGLGSAPGAMSVTFEYDIITLDDKLASGFSSTSHVATLDVPKGKLEQGINNRIDFAIDGSSFDIVTTVRTNSF